MARTVKVTLTGLARRADFEAVITVSSIRPRAVEYALACVTVDIDGCDVTCQTQGITETAALNSIARWLIKTFGAKAATLDHHSEPVLRAAA